MNGSEQHPLKDQLVAFSLGKVDPNEADQIAEHLYGCQRCSESIVDVQDDTFVSLVRNSPAPAPIDEAELKCSESSEAHPEVTVDIESRATEGNERSPTELPLDLRHHPRYEVLELIGRGGMGDVYKAQHMMMNRVVALKVIKPELVKNEAAVERFRREVQTAARLQHPNIVTAYDAEQAGNLHFLVMEYVDGESLDQLVARKGRLTVTEACDYIRQTAEGLQHAHDMGMVHRDIKPHNLMLARQTGTIIGSVAVVKILDFGLANFANDVAADELSIADNTYDQRQSSQDIAPGASIMQQLTQMGTMMGTPDYIAPEQAADAHGVDIRADIYSLGCTFYTLLTGEPPFGEGSVLEKIKAHTQAEARPLSDFRQDLPHAVEGVLQKMMAKDINDRYQTPLEVALALQEILSPSATPVRSTKPIESARSTPDFKVKRGGVRKTLPVALGVLLSVFAMLAGAAVLYLQTNYGTVRVQVNDESLRVAINGQAIRVNDGDTDLKVRPGEKTLLIQHGDFEFETDRFQLKRGEAVGLTVEFLEGQFVVTKNGNLFASRELPGDESPATRDLDGITLVEKLEGHRDAGAGSGALDASADGRWLVSAGNNDQTARLWDMRTNGLQHVFAGPEATVGRVAISPDGRIAAGGCHDGRTFVWDCSSGKILHELSDGGDSVSSLAFSPSGGRLMTTTSQGSTVIWETKAGTQLISHDFGGWGWDTDFFDENEAMISSGGTVFSWDLSTDEVVHRCTVLGACTSIAVSADHHTLLTGNKYKDGVCIQVWDVESGRESRRFIGHQGAIHSVQFLPDERYILSGGGDGRMMVWDRETGREVARKEGLGHLANTAIPLARGREAASFGKWHDGVAAKGDDFAVRLWRLPESVWAKEEVDTGGF